MSDTYRKLRRCYRLAVRQLIHENADNGQQIALLLGALRSLTGDWFAGLGLPARYSDYWEHRKGRQILHVSNACRNWLKTH